LFIDWLNNGKILQTGKNTRNCEKYYKLGKNTRNWGKNTRNWAKY